MTTKMNELSSLGVALKVLFVTSLWPRSWALVAPIALVVACGVYVTQSTVTSKPAQIPSSAPSSQLATIGPILTESASSVRNFSGVSVKDTIYPGYGWLIVVSISVPGGVEGTYWVRREGNEYKCAILEQSLNQLDCNVPLLPGWDQAVFDVYSAGGEAAVFQFACRRIASMDSPEKPDSPEWGCQMVR